MCCVGLNWNCVNHSGVRTNCEIMYKLLKCLDYKIVTKLQRWSPRGRPWPRGHILKPLALALKVKSLASKPQVLENFPVLGSRTALFFKSLNFCWKTPKTSQKILQRRFLCSSVGDCLKKKTVWRTLAPVFLVFGLGLKHFCLWPREVLSSEGLALASDFFRVLGLEPCVLDSTFAKLLL